MNVVILAVMVVFIFFVRCDGGRGHIGDLCGVYQHSRGCLRAADPQAGNDKNGASSISFMTWSLFLLAHLSTVAYAIINRSDWGSAACFAINAACCAAILVIAYWKRRSHAKWLHCKGRPPLCATA